MQIAFERKVVLMDSSLRDAAKLTSDTIFAFLNEAIDKFYKTRYSGTNIKGEGFEQSQKRIDDLRFLIKTIKIFWLIIRQKVTGTGLLEKTQVRHIQEKEEVYEQRQCQQKFCSVYQRDKPFVAIN